MPIESNKSFKFIGGRKKKLTERSPTARNPLRLSPSNFGEKTEEIDILSEDDFKLQILNSNKSK